MQMREVRTFVDWLKDPAEKIILKCLTCKDNFYAKGMYNRVECKWCKRKRDENNFVYC